MLEILQSFEAAVSEATRSRSLVLAGSGGAVIAVGLCIWLGGVSLRKPLVAMAGAVAGSVFSVVLIAKSLVVLAGSAVVAAVIARVFERVFITVTGAALAASIGFAVLAGPYMKHSQAVSAANQDGASARVTTGQASSGMERLEAYVIRAGDKIKRTVWLMPPQRWAIVVLLAALPVVGGAISWRATAAACFSVAGTILVFAGMILLLVYKGAAPVSRMSSRPLTCLGFLVAMVLFGTAEQLLLCRGAKRQADRPEKAQGRTEESQHSCRSWRTG